MDRTIKILIVACVSLLLGCLGGGYFCNQSPLLFWGSVLVTGIAIAVGVIWASL